MSAARPLRVPASAAGEKCRRRNHRAPARSGEGFVTSKSWTASAACFAVACCSSLNSASVSMRRVPNSSGRSSGTSTMCVLGQIPCRSGSPHGVRGGVYAAAFEGAGAGATVCATRGCGQHNRRDGRNERRTNELFKDMLAIVAYRHLQEVRRSRTLRTPRIAGPPEGGHYSCVFVNNAGGGEMTAANLSLHLRCSWRALSLTAAHPVRAVRRHAVSCRCRRSVSPDTHLVLTFPSAPTLGKSGQIRIYDAADNRLVDTLDLSIPPGPTTGAEVRRRPTRRRPTSTRPRIRPTPTPTPGNAVGRRGAHVPRLPAHDHWRVQRRLSLLSGDRPRQGRDDLSASQSSAVRQDVLRADRSRRADARRRQLQRHQRAQRGWTFTTKRQRRRRRTRRAWSSPPTAAAISRPCRARSTSFPIGVRAASRSSFATATTKRSSTSATSRT